MTPSDQADRDSRRESAKRDLQDIAALRRTEAFSRYFLRRLRDKHTDAEQHFKYDEPAKCDAVQRELWRQRMLLLEEIINMSAVDERIGMQELE